MNVRHFTAIILSLMVAGTLSAAGESPSILGTWKATGDLPDGGTNETTLTITKEGDGFLGSVIDEDGDESKLDRIRIDDDKVVLELDVERDDQRGVIRVVAEEAEPGQLAGRWFLINAEGEELAEAAWKAVRLSEPEEEAPVISLVGKWNAKATLGDGRELPSVVTFEEKDGDLTGKSASDRGETAFDSVKVDGKKVAIEMTIDINGNELDLRIEADLKDEDHLDGKWVIFDDTGQESATGAWEAERIREFNLAGTWDVTAATDDAEHEHQSIFERTDEGYKGRVESESGTSDYTSVEVSGKNVSLVIPSGEGTIKITATAETNDKLTGKWAFFDSEDAETASNTWVALRKAAAPDTEPEEEPAPGITGEWNLTVKLGETERDYAMRIEKGDGDTLKGTLVSPRSGEHELDSVTFQDGEFTAKVTRDIQGNEIPFVYKGKLQDDGTLSGSFIPEGYEDQFSGEWTGKRKND